MSQGLVEYGFEQIFKAVVDKFNAQGKSNEDIIQEIDRYPLSKGLKLKIEGYLNDDWEDTAPPVPFPRMGIDAIKNAGSAVMGFWDSQMPLLKSGIEQLQDATRKYPKNHPFKSQETTEKIIRDEVASQLLNSQIEVATESGRIDILTDDQIIEVKNVNAYKHAIGQVLSYGHYYPQHQKCIYLFGAVRKKQRTLIEAECTTAGVVVLFHEYLK
jgi:hypothetical protein